MIIAVSVAVLAVLGIALHIFFMRKLQLKCPDEWERLGSPNPFLPNDPQTSWRLTKYVMGGAFETLPDKGVVRVGQILRVFEWSWVCGWTSYVALIAFVMVPLWVRAK
jgi:hypothetical protein